MTISSLNRIGTALFGVIVLACCLSLQAAETPEIRTPTAPHSPRINGPRVYGVTPGAPFLYYIPVTGDRPMTFVVDDLPEGLALNATNGQITGKLAKAGEHVVVLRAKNQLGTAEKTFRIVCGDTIALTPPMGWNSWNCWAAAADHDKVLRSAKAMISSGLADHGWTYINIDDTWQGKRHAPEYALQPNEKFPDMKKLCDEIHALGLKVGIYSSPWVTTFAGFPGDGSDNEKGEWIRVGDYPAYTVGQHTGKFSFAASDARQFAAWGIDYLKYDWAPNDVAHTDIMGNALRSTGRDIVYSLSCSASVDDVAGLSRFANCWRTTGDLWDSWDAPGTHQRSFTEIGFNQDSWTKASRPGHWNDCDMLVVGFVGWGPNLHPTRLTPAEQYTHITLWCMLSSPLLIGCDMERLDAFTLNLLTNDEVLAINQDTLGKQACRAATIGSIDVYRKDLEDGSIAYAFFNRGDITHTIETRLDRLGMNGKYQARDVWRQKNIGTFDNAMPITVEAHDVVLLKMTAAK